MRRRRGSGSIVKRGNVYWLYHTRYGKLKGETLNTTNKQDAERIARERLKEIDTEIAQKQYIEKVSQPITILPPSYQYIPAQVAVMQQAFEQQLKESNQLPLDTFWKLGKKKEEDSGKYIDWYCQQGFSGNTIKNYRTAYSKLRTLFPHIEFMDQVNKGTAQEFNQLSIRDGLKPAGVYQYTLILHALWSVAIKEEWYSGDNPFKPKRPKNIKSKDRFLTHSEVDKILEVAKKEDEMAYLFIMIAINTGMRKDEIMNLRWEDINWEQKIVRVQSKEENKELGIVAFTTKSKKDRPIPLKDGLKDVLLPLKQDTGYIVTFGNIQRNRSDVYHYMDKIQIKANIKFTPHLFRHTFASWAANAGIPMFDIQGWLGHSSIQMTSEVYAHHQSYNDNINKF